MSKKRDRYSQKLASVHSGGQALVVLLFYMVIAITLTTTAVALTMSNSITTMQQEQGDHALEIAESGAENAVLRLLRDNSFTGETISVDSGTAVTTVSGTTTKTIISTGKINLFTRVVEATITFHNGRMEIGSWHEQ